MSESQRGSLISNGSGSGGVASPSVASASASSNANPSPERIIKEVMHKITQVVVRARIPTHGELEKSPLNKWFNLQVPEWGGVRGELDVLLRSGDPAQMSNSSTSSSQVFSAASSMNGLPAAPSNSTSPVTSGMIQLDIILRNSKNYTQYILLERWNVQHERHIMPNSMNDPFGTSTTSTSSSSSAALAASRKTDGPSLYKKLILLVRSLYSFVKLLPAHQAWRTGTACIERRESCTFQVGHQLSSSEKSSTYLINSGQVASNTTIPTPVFDISPVQYTFNAIATPMGRFTLSVFYRQALNDIEWLTIPMMTRNNHRLSISQHTRPGSNSIHSGAASASSSSAATAATLNSTSLHAASAPSDSSSSSNFGALSGDATTMQGLMTGFGEGTIIADYMSAPETNRHNTPAATHMMSSPVAIASPNSANNFAHNNTNNTNIAPNFTGTSFGSSSRAIPIPAKSSASSRSGSVSGAGSYAGGGRTPPTYNITGPGSFGAGGGGGTGSGPNSFIPNHATLAFPPPILGTSSPAPSGLAQALAAQQQQQQQHGVSSTRSSSSPTAILSGPNTNTSSPNLVPVRNSLTNSPLQFGATRNIGNTMSPLPPPSPAVPFGSSRAIPIPAKPYTSGGGGGSAGGSLFGRTPPTQGAGSFISSSSVTALGLMKQSQSSSVSPSPPHDATLAGGQQQQGRRASLVQVGSWQSSNDPTNPIQLSVTPFKQVPSASRKPSMIAVGSPALPPPTKVHLMQQTTPATTSTSAAAISNTNILPPPLPFGSPLITAATPAATNLVDDVASLHPSGDIGLLNDDDDHDAELGRFRAFLSSLQKQESESPMALFTHQSDGSSGAHTNTNDAAPNGRSSRSQSISASPVLTSTSASASMLQRSTGGTSGSMMNGSVIRQTTVQSLFDSMDKLGLKLPQSRQHVSASSSSSSTPQPQVRTLQQPGPAAQFQLQPQLRI